MPYYEKNHLPESNILINYQMKNINFKGKKI